MTITTSLQVAYRSLTRKVDFDWQKEGDCLAPLDPKEAHKELETILSKKAFQIYHHHDQNILTDLWNRFKSWLSHWLEKLFPRLDIPETSPHWALYVIVGLILLFILFLVFQLWRHFTRVRAYRARRFGSESELAQSVLNHLNEAEGFANNGELKLAIRHTFLALILHLDGSGRLEARPWKTNFEYYAELEADSKELADQFIERASYFEEIVYGNHPVELKDYQTYRSHIENWINRETAAACADGQGGAD